MDAVAHTPLPCPSLVPGGLRTAFLAGVALRAVRSETAAREPLSCNGFQAGEVASSTRGSTSSPPEPRDQSARRATAYHLRAASRPMVRDLHDSLACCGSVYQPHRPRGAAAPDMPDMATLMVRDDGSASFTGITRCGSPWACPTCAPRIAAARAETLRPQVASLMGRGWSAQLVTLTLRHDRHQKMSDLWTALGKAWARLTSGKRWAALKATGGLEYVRGYDATYSPAYGWHPHVHISLYLSPDHKDPDAVGRWVLDRWMAVLARLGWSALPGAQHVQRVNDPEAAAAYAVTAAACYESVALALKRARGGRGGRTPFEILEAAAAGDPHAWHLWREYVSATKGRRQVTTSRNFHLKELESETEDVVEGDEEVDLPVADIGPHAMRELDWRRLSSVLLDAVEAADAALGDVYEAAASVLGQLSAGDWGLCRPPEDVAPAPAPEVCLPPPSPVPWVVHDPRKGKPGARGERAIRDYLEWRASLS